MTYARFCDYFFMTTNSNGANMFRSRDGVTWSLVIDSHLARTGFGGFNVVVSEELGIVLAHFNPSTAAYNRVRYSRNGLDWYFGQHPYNGAMSGAYVIEWIPQLHMFVAASNWVGMSYSFDGISWTIFYPEVASAASCLMTYSEVQGCMSFKFASKLYRTKGFGIKSMAGPMLSVSQSGFLALNSPITSSPLTIGSVDGNLIKFKDNLDQWNVGMSLASNMLTLSAHTVNIGISASSAYGITINGIAIPFNFWQYGQSFVAGSSATNTIPGKIAVLGSDSSLYGALSCDSLTVNGTSANLSSLALSNLPSVSGVAEVNKVIVTDANGNVKFPVLNMQSLQGGYTEVSCEATGTINWDVLNQCMGTHPSGAYEYALNLTTGSTLGSYSGVTNISIATQSSTYLNSSSKGIYVDHLNAYVAFHPTSQYAVIFNRHLTNPRYVTIPTAYSTPTKVVYILETKRVYLLRTTGPPLFSTNMESWSVAQCSASVTGWNSIAFSQQLNIYVAATNLGIFLSRDGEFFFKADTIATSVLATVSDVVWCSEWGLFICSSSSATPSFFSSSDGIHWDATLINTIMPYYSENLSTGTFAYSNKLQMVVYSNGGGFIYASWDGKIFARVATVGIYNQQVRWSKELEVFILGTNSTSAFCVASSDGVNWYTSYNGSGALFSNSNDMFYNKSIAGISTFTATSTPTIAYTSPNYYNFDAYNTNAVMCEFENIQVDNVNSRLGIGKSPDYTLELSADSALKPSTNSWATSSDARLKEEIEPADVRRCLEVVESIPLKHYRWKASLSARQSDNGLLDNSQLGWIAQDVETVLPKSVSCRAREGLDDCRDLNSDQIISNMWGALQCLVSDVEELLAGAQ
jgi:hypothetical protein